MPTSVFIIEASKYKDEFLYLAQMHRKSAPS